MLPLTKEELKSNEQPKACYVCGKIILKKLYKSINHWEVRDNFHYISEYRDAAQSICNLKFNVPNEIPVDFQNGSNYDYHKVILFYFKRISK